MSSYKRKFEDELTLHLECIRLDDTDTQAIGEALKCKTKLVFKVAPEGGGATAARGLFEMAWLLQPKN